MKKIILIVLIIFSTCSSGSSQRHHLIDSIKVELKSIHEDSTRIKLFRQLSNEYSAIQVDSAIYYAMKAYEMSVQTNDLKSKYRTTIFLSNLYSEKGINDKALEYALLALKFAGQGHDKKQQMNANFSISKLYSEHLKNFPKALEYGKYALKISKDIGDLNLMIENLEGVSTIYFNYGKYDDALIYANEEYATALKLKDTRRIIWALASVGDCYRVMKNYALAEKNYLLAIDQAKTDSIHNSLANLYNNLAVIYDQTDKKKAIGAYLTAIRIAERLNDPESLSFYNQQISNTYLNLKEYAKALDYNQRALQFEESRQALPQLKGLYLQNARINDSLKNYKEASRSFDQYITITDQLQSSESQNKLSELEVALESEKKQKQIDLLNKDNAIQKIVRNSFVIGFAVMLLFAIVFFRQRNKINKEKKRIEVERQRSDNLLLNILPADVAAELKQNGKADAKQLNEVTVMFTDFKNFSGISEKLTPSELVNEIDIYFKAFDKIIGDFGIEKIKTIGDSYMCANGLVTEAKKSAIDMLKAAMEMQRFVRNRIEERRAEGKEAFDMRIGIHTGSIVAGIVGIKKFAYDIWGDTVNIASRMESSGEEGKVNISGSTFQLINEHFNCTYRGKIKAKNKGEIDMYFVDQQILS